MRVDTELDHFQEMTDFLSREARSHVLDSLACVFHNEGYGLEGNTEENDTLWLANLISVELDGKELERQSPHQRDKLLRLAKVAKDSLPLLAERMAARYIRISKAIRACEQIAKRQRTKAQQQNESE